MSAFYFLWLVHFSFCISCVPSVENFPRRSSTLALQKSPATNPLLLMNLSAAWLKVLSA